MPTTTDWRQALPWLADRGLCLLPIGAKPPERKAPVDPDTGYGLRNWQHSTGYTTLALAAMAPAHVIAVGINTGHGGILVVDIDGKTAAEWIRQRGLDPLTAGTWIVARDTDPDRYKLIFRLTPEQQALFPQTKLLLRTVNGEALEIYFQPGAQVLVLGEHCKSGGNYTWGGTPADIATPSAEWMDIFVAIREAVEALRGKGDTSRPPRISGVSTNGIGWSASGHGRPCPICARERSAACTWTTATDGRRIASCFHGSADHCPPANLNRGAVITGRDGHQWAYIRDYQADCLGDKSLFIEHQDRPQQPQQQPPEPWQPADPQPAPQPPTAAPTAAARLNLTPQDAIDDECHRIHCLPSNDPARLPAINALLRAAADLVEATQDGDTLIPDLVTQISDLGIGRREAKAVIKDRRLEIQQERREAVKRQRLDAVRAQAAATPDPILQLISSLPTPPDGKIDAGTLLGALRPQQQNAFRLRFNLMFRAVELDGAEIPEHTVELAHTRLQEAGWKVGKNDTIDALLSLARSDSYHPVIEYLDRVEHDNTLPYIDLNSIASTYLGTDPSDPLNDEMMKVALIGAVRRIREPACQHDTVVVFQGKQGCGKTNFWKALAGSDDHGEPWYSPCTSAREVDMLMAMHRAWIVEFAELEGITSRHEISALRTLITTTADPFRVPYGRVISMNKRRFLLVGTVNPSGFLNDPEGHRRFHCIPLPDDCVINVDAVARDRDAIWKAAAMAHTAGQPSYLSHKLQEASNDRNHGEHVVETAWDAPIAKWAGDQVAKSPFSIAEVLVLSGVRDKGHIQPNDYGKVAQILKTLGWVRHPTKSKKAWMRP